jgi:antagonist of KipI
VINMSVPLLKVLKPGLSSSIQDSGRLQWQSFGVPASGVMDRFSHRVGNILLGNKPTEAVIEIIMGGFEVEVLNNIHIVISGADLQPAINGVPVPLWRVLTLKKGDNLKFSGPKQGTYCYLAIADGIEAPNMMGSKSSYAQAGIGENFKKGLILYGKEGRACARVGLRTELVPIYEKNPTIRINLGPNVQYFNEDTIEQLFKQRFAIKQFSRMGYRLQGEPLNHSLKNSLLSNAVPYGAIQVPSNGQPIVLMVDRQTTGGYPVIGTVITVDLPKMAQVQSGNHISFQHVTIEEAHQLIADEFRFYKHITDERRKN